MQNKLNIQDTNRNRKRHNHTFDNDAYEQFIKVCRKEQKVPSRVLDYLISRYAQARL